MLVQLESKDIEKSSKKAAILIPYFGKWPTCFQVYLKGCEINPWLQIIFLTDCPIPKIFPTNVKFYVSTLAKISQLATLKLGAPIAIKGAYKLCDFRPFYGKMFEEYLSEYLYWGYGDIDVVYGNMAPFYLPKIEKGYDVISSRKVLVSGSFTLVKNTPALNWTAYQTPGFVRLLQSERYEHLDETGGSDIVWKGRSKLELPHNCFTHFIAEQEANGNLRASFEDLCKEHINDGEIIHFSSNTLLFNDQPLAYLHYVNSKGKNGFAFPNHQSIPDQFYITNTGYYSEKDLKFARFIGHYRKLKGSFTSMVKRIIRKINKQ